MITPQETGALPVDNLSFTLRHSTLVMAHNQMSPRSSIAITPQETGALCSDQVSIPWLLNPSMLGSLDDQVSIPSSPPTGAKDHSMSTLRLSRDREGPEDPPTPKVQQGHADRAFIIQATWPEHTLTYLGEAAEGRPLEANADTDVDMDHESQMVEQILQFKGKNLDLKAMNESYNKTIRDERESFQRKLESLEASMNEKMATMKLEQAKLERELIEKSNSVLALRSSLMATPINHSKTQMVAVKAHHINLPIINVTPDSSEASSRVASASKLASTSVIVSAGQEPLQTAGIAAVAYEPITHLTGPAMPSVASASIPGRIQTPIPIFVTGQTHTIGAPPPVFSTPTPTKCPPPVTMATNTSSSVPAMQQSNPILNTSLSAPGTSTILACPLPDQLEGIDFSNPDIPSPAIINALTLLMNAMKTGKPSIEGYCVSQKPGTQDYWLQVKCTGKIQLTHAQELRYNALVQEVWREVFNVERLNDFISYTPADPEEVMSYNLEDGDGPGKHFTLDFSKGWCRSNWNTTILNKIAIKVKNTNESNHDWNLPTVSDDYISVLLWKFHRQTGIVTNVIALKTESDAPDLQYWNLLKMILNQLGHHGMSPEESGTQMVNGMAMQTVGELPSLQGQKASQPSKRIYSDTDCNSRVPPGLPRAMYNDAWLKDLSRFSVQELQILEEAFKFLNLAVQNL
ncbi:hypothetical protein IW262DRAFT_1461978 [Armillaria fumosa]|nr:hypothetical protein IW262DRAFT_1461978 [Armillaria fumosa]